MDSANLALDSANQDTQSEPVSRADAPKIFAREYIKTCNIYQSMLAAGYPESTAHMGRAGVPQKLWDAVTMHPGARELIAMGGAINAEQQENLVRGRLIKNTIAGKDSGVMSAKYLGSDKRVNMFQPDIATGNIVIIDTLALPGQPQPAKIIDSDEDK